MFDQIQEQFASALADGTLLHLLKFYAGIAVVLAVAFAKPARKP